MTQHFVLMPNITVSHVDENNNFDNNNCNKNDDGDDDGKNNKEQKVHLLELPSRHLETGPKDLRLQAVP